MSIQSYFEKFISTLDAAFEREANNLLNEARQKSGKESYVAGKIDGLHESARMAKETYNLFVKSENDEDDDAKAIY